MCYPILDVNKDTYNGAIHDTFQTDPMIDVILQDNLI